VRLPDREHRVLELRRLIEAGEYRVDPAAVADAIVHRIRYRIAAGEPRRLREPKTSARSLRAPRHRRR
jgi:Anti-sigma-28 factor, FlgM